MHLISRLFGAASIFPWLWVYLGVRHQYIECLTGSAGQDCAQMYNDGVASVALLTFIFSAFALALSIFAYYRLPIPRPVLRVIEIVAFAIVFSMTFMVMLNTR